MAVFGDTTRLGASSRLARPEQVRGATQPQRTGTTERERSATRGEIVRAIRDAVRGIEVALQVPGIHYSGLTYDHLLAILAAQGRGHDVGKPAQGTRHPLYHCVNLNWLMLVAMASKAEPMFSVVALK